MSRAIASCKGFEESSGYAERVGCRVSWSEAVLLAAEEWLEDLLQSRAYEPCEDFIQRAQ